MSWTMCVGVAFILDSAMVHATLQWRCPSDGKPQNVVSLLHTHMNLSQGIVPYVLNELGAGTCPSGFQTITDMLQDSDEPPAEKLSLLQLQHTLTLAHDVSSPEEFQLPDMPYEVSKVAETKILHIGKTGGLSLEAAFQHTTLPSKVGFFSHEDSRRFVQERLSGTPHPAYKDIVFFVRSPVHRFISAWLWIFRGGQWSSRTKWAFETFPTPEDLACNLSSTDPDMVARAQTAMSSIYHVYRGIAWYVGGLSGARELASQILFVGTTEHYSDDFLRLAELLDARSSFKGGLPQEEHKHVRDCDMQFKKLSRCSVLNLRKWYSEDYQIIRFLATRGLLNGSYVDEIDKFDAIPIEGQHSFY